MIWANFPPSWPLFTGLLGLHRLETVGRQWPRLAQSLEAVVYECPALSGRNSTWELPPATTLHWQPDSKLRWSFPSWAWCPSKHSQQDSSASFLEKTVAFFSWARKMQTNNLLHLCKPKTALRLGWPVSQLPLWGSWEDVHACGGWGETQVREEPL